MILEQQGQNPSKLHRGDGGPESGSDAFLEGDLSHLVFTHIHKALPTVLSCVPFTILLNFSEKTLVIPVNCKMGMCGGWKENPGPALPSLVKRGHGKGFGAQDGPRAGFRAERRH